MVRITVAGRGRPELGFVMDLVPRDNVLATRSDRSTDCEDQPALERDLQQPQYTTAEIVVRQIAHAGEAHGVIRLARIRMFATLNSGWDTGKH